MHSQCFALLLSVRQLVKLVISNKYYQLLHPTVIPKDENDVKNVKVIYTNRHCLSLVYIQAKYN